MPGKMTIYKTDGTTTVANLDEAPDFVALQKVVGGTIQVVPRWPGPGVAFCNDDGKILNLPLNEQATQLWNVNWDVLVGDVAVVDGDHDFMEGL